MLPRKIADSTVHRLAISLRFLEEFQDFAVKLETLSYALSHRTRA